MRYVMKQKILSLTDQFTIKQEDGKDAFQIKGKLISLGKKLKLFDAQGKEVAQINQKLVALTPTYNIYCGDKLQARINKKIIKVLTDKFKVNMMDGSPDLEIKGNILDHEYTFFRGKDKIAESSKKWVTIRDTYSIDVNEGEDEVLILACAVVIDMIAHSPQRNTSDD
jgi:uncharacterized protein YxjI